MSLALSASMLAACTGNGNEMDEQPEDVNYEPTRYNGENIDMYNNRGRDIDTDPRDIKESNEPDTPYNMDEEEPGLDEEPSEERRGK